MTFMNAKALAVTAALLLGSTAAIAECDERLEIDTEQVRDHLALLKSPDADELDQIDVLGPLLCAKRESVRDLAFRAGLASPSRAVQAETLLAAMKRKRTMVVEFVEEEDISSDVRAYIKDTIAVDYQLNHVEDESCAGLDTNRQCKSYFVDIHGNQVEITYGRDLGSFSLDESGELKGFFKPANLSAKVPARIKLL
ncbi:MAG: hypothetical protein AAF543_13180 [Pseudomonadota bacterium]